MLVGNFEKNCQELSVSCFVDEAWNVFHPFEVPILTQNINFHWLFPTQHQLYQLFPL